MIYIYIYHIHIYIYIIYIYINEYKHMKLHEESILQENN